VSEPYDPDNLLDRLSDRPTLEVQYRQIERREREILRRRLGRDGGDVLSVGCGWHPGRHLFPAGRWRMTGVDADPAKVTAVRERGLVEEAFVGRAGALELAPASFDVVLYRLVLHHVAYVQPLAPLVSEAARLLRPGGVLVINHPNLESIDRWLFGRFWLGYELPRHLYLFPTELLRRLMADQGMAEVERRCLYGSHAASSTSLTFIAEAYLGQGRASRVIGAILFSKICRALFVPYFRLVDQWGLGSNVTVVFKRPHARER